MATFEIGIGKEDIQEAQLMPEDWYLWELTRDPYEGKNAAWKEVGENLSFDDAYALNEKAGKNIILNGKIISDVPEFNGRTFTKWLSLPNKFDEGLWMNNGQPKGDWKAEQIYLWLEALQGEAEGTKVNFVKGQKCYVYIEQGPDQSGENTINQIGMNNAPRPVGDGGMSGGESFGADFDPLEGGNSLL